MHGEMEDKQNSTQLAHASEAATSRSAGCLKVAQLQRLVFSQAGLSQAPKESHTQPGGSRKDTVVGTATQLLSDTVLRH